MKKEKMIWEGLGIVVLLCQLAGIFANTCLTNW